jgi:hypothetical protein
MEFSSNAAHFSSMGGNRKLRFVPFTVVQTCGAGTRRSIRKILKTIVLRSYYVEIRLEILITRWQIVPSNLISPCLTAAYVALFSVF